MSLLCVGAQQQCLGEAMGWARPSQGSVFSSLDFRVFPSANPILPRLKAKRGLKNPLKNSTTSSFYVGMFAKILVMCN